MSKASDAEKQEAVRQLREWVKPGDTIYTTLERVSRSGMQREIRLYKIHDNEPQWLSGYASKALGMRRGKRDGIVVGGCGMDMGFHLVYALSHVLFPDGFGCIGEGNGYGTRCPSNDHSNGDRDYTMNHCDGREKIAHTHDNGCHWHRSGGYALRHRWL